MPDLISAPSLAQQPAGTLNLHLLLVILKIWNLDETRVECVCVRACVCETNLRASFPKALLLSSPLTSSLEKSSAAIVVSVSGDSNLGDNRKN